jgi:1-acyl-sn-glycerol-3-phosphate acyltransferase
MDLLKSVVIWLLGVTFVVLFFPVTAILWFFSLPFDRNRALVHLILTWQACLLSYLVPIWKLKIEGRQKAERKATYIIISNHQSILDILLINCLRFRYKWISKIENLKVPVLGWYLRMASYITVDRGNKESKEAMLAEAELCLRKGISLMIFPEGTRSADCEIGFFKRGAFQLAISTGLPILPVLIDGTGAVLPKHGLIFGGYHSISLRVLDPVPASAFGTADPDELALNFQNFMKEELKRLRETTNS